jgi:class 3 adenylate cyclase/tetratricopeptide (TPR) repeat protein
VARCPSCGAELPAEARFCAFCGTPIVSGRVVAEERRTVTILFADLVGFTERSDRADPEDVRRTLVPFHRRVKEDLERYGGTLDKFIGDAVMGVFGAPIAHDDDPTRAVRAALAVLRSVGDLQQYDPGLAVRVAVNTGEALVSFGVGPQIGEAVAGDVVNTASRMQALAERDSVVIGETTLRAVRDRFEVEALPVALVKGKAEPLAVWRVVGERAVTEAERTLFVGRRRELATLVDRFEGVKRLGTAALVTVVAEAGVGKSRLVSELAWRLANRARTLIGACRPYGEGVTFAPVEQTVGALIGAELTDDPATWERRLEELAARVEPDPAERRWLVRTLGAVLALQIGVEGGASEIGPDELAQAWARVLDAAAGERPLLLVIEDLHHAAPALIEVLASTIELLAGRPVLGLATMRPGSGGGAPQTLASSSTLALGALDEDDARELVGAVLLDSAISEAARATVLERSAGNPLYAIEFARMVMESGSLDEAATPASVRAVIAARLDAAPPEVRALVPDAAVLGDEVWPEALASMDERSLSDVRDGLVDLERRGLLVARASTFPDREAFGFTQGLVREVAYARLPRSARAQRHLAAGRWLEDAAGDRAEEWAESLARHYVTAAELGAESGQAEVVESATGPAIRWLLAAGDRAMRVDPAAAFAAFEHALALAAPGTREREETLRRSAVAGRRSGRLDAADVLARNEEALAIARARGDEVAIGETLTRIGSQLAVLEEVERAKAALAEAVETLERYPPGRELARAYAYRAEEELFSGDARDAIAYADRALGLVEDEGDEIAVMALHIRGDARCSMRDLDGGLADLADALRRAEDVGRVGDVVSSLNYLAEWRWATEGPAAGLEEWERALELAERRNMHSQAEYAKASALWALLESGRWDRVLEWSNDLLAQPPARLDPAISVIARVTRAHVLLARGRRAEVGDPDELVSLAERIRELHALSPALVAAAAIAIADGDRERAASRLEAFEAVTEGVAPEYRAVELARAVRLALAAGRVELAERFVAAAEPLVLRDRLRLEAARAMASEARADPAAAETYSRLANRLREYGEPYEESMALLGLARLTGAEEPRARARALLDALGVPA